MTCHHCGAPVADGLRYCGYCGTSVQDPVGGSSPATPDRGSLIDRIGLALSGEYQVEQELARGGMGVVFKARELGQGRLVALKVLAPELALHERAAERFKREARTVTDLDHPNIVPVYRVGQAGDVLYIAMKFIEGRPLGKLIEAQGALPVPVVIHVLRSSALALAYAHERGIVHRDVKGDNILVDSDGHALMTDFGVALRAADVTLTVDGAVVGTPAFMSPEQCAGTRAGPQSDQYSLGVVAFYMLAGSAPFASETIAGYIQHHLTTPVPDIRPVRDDLPEGLVAVVNRALAKDLRDRFDTTRQMVAAIDAIPQSPAERRDAQETLRQLSRGAALARVSARFIPPVQGAATLVLPRPRRRPARRWAVALSTAAVLTLGTAIAFRLAPSTPPAPAAGAAAPAADSGPMSTDRVVAATSVSTLAATESPAPAQIPAATGRLRLLTAPPDAQILVDGRPVGIGSVFDLLVTAGARRIQARASGYLPYDTVVTVAPEGTVNLGRVALRTPDDRP